METDDSQYPRLKRDSEELFGVKLVECLLVNMLARCWNKTAPADVKAGQLTNLQAAQIAHDIHKLDDTTASQAEAFAKLAKKLRHFYAHVPSALRLQPILELAATQPFTVFFATMQWLSELDSDNFEAEMASVCRNILHEGYHPGVLFKFWTEHLRPQR